MRVHWQTWLVEALMMAAGILAILLIYSLASVLMPVLFAEGTLLALSQHKGDSLALLQGSKKNLASPLRTEDRSILFQDGCKGFTVVGHRDFLLPVIFAVKVINSPFHLALEVQGAHGLLLDCINFTYPGVTVEGLHHDDLYVSWGLDKCVTNTTSKNQTPTGIQKEDFTVVLKGTGRSLTVNINGRANLTYPRNFDDDVRNIRLVASPNLRVRLPVPSLEQGCVVGSYFMCKTKNKYAHLTMQNYDKVYIRKIYANEYFSLSDPCTKEDKEAVLQPSYFERSDWVPAQVQVRKTSIQYLINLIIGGEVRGEYQSFYRTYDLDCGKNRMKGIRVSFKADFSLNCNPEPQLEEEEHDPYRSYYITRLQVILVVVWVIVIWSVILLVMVARKVKAAINNTASVTASGT